MIDKYNDLAREAQSNGDKILSENYLQHADHFTRILNEKENVRKEKFAENKSEPLEENLKNGDQNPDKDAENLNNEEKNNFKNTKSQPEVN